ncbi:lichenicidin A2 family type 2 lantibiotic [Halobacillus sp. MO56]
MNRTQIAKALKNPELRTKLGVESPAGETLGELNKDELSRINGGSDVQPETSPTCVTIGITLSLAYCP